MIDIIKYLSGIDVSDYVTSENEFMPELKEFNTYYTADARSAAFYAFGKSNRENKPVALIINGEYLPNVYTAVTEAWFQKTNLIVVALYNTYREINCGYMDRCVINNIIADKTDISDIKPSDILCAGPVLINIFGEALSKRKYNYAEVLNCLDSVVEKNTPLFCYAPDNIVCGALNIKPIDDKHKYGVLSKYFGYTIASEKKAVLCCTADCVTLDMNIFNNRYTTSNIKIIILDNDNIISHNRINEWIGSNNFTCREIKTVSIDKIKQFYEEECASVIIVRGERD